VSDSPVCITGTYDQPLHSYNLSHSLLSSFKIYALMAQKQKGHKSVCRIAPNTVFHQIAQCVRQHQFRLSPLPISPASVSQPDCPSAVPSFSTSTVRHPDRALAPSTAPSFLTPTVMAPTPRQTTSLHLSPSSPVSAESTSRQQNRAHAQMKRVSSFS
jgi:hypothetical protein